MQECDATTTEFQKMIGSKKTGPTIVDTHKIVGTARGIFVKITVEKDNGNFCALESGQQVLIDLRCVGIDFNRSEKNSRNRAIDILSADCIDFAFGAFGSIGRRPENRMPARLSRLDQFPADWIKDFRFAESVHEQTE